MTANHTANLAVQDGQIVRVPRPTQLPAGLSEEELMQVYADTAKEDK